MKVGIGLNVKNSVEAVALYQEAFGLTLGYHVKNPDGSFYHSELYHDGEEVLAVVESTDKRNQAQAVQIGMIFDTKESLERAFNLLCVGGTVDSPIGSLPWSPCAASVIDRFGVWWYLSLPQHMPGPDFDPTIPY